jgi:alpha-tubulin suppressor-like RCC1 family protein
MRSKDVQKEVELAIKYNKKRFEIKIDDTKQSSLFKFAFDGIKWFEFDDVHRFKHIHNRIFDELYSEKVNKLSATTNTNIHSTKKLERSLRPIIGLLILAIITITSVYFVSISLNNESIIVSVPSSPSSNNLYDENELGEITNEVNNSDESANSPETIIEDTTPPVLTVFGDLVIELDYGTPFIDPGVSVKDNTDEEPTIVIEGEVDSFTPGTYTITYTARDSSNNATSVQRTIIVLNQIERIINVFAGGNNSYAVTNTNRIFSWGKNLDGTVGDGSNMNRNSAVEITSNFLFGDVNLDSKVLKTIQAGDDYAVALFEDGTMFYWGNLINSHCFDTIASNQSNLPVPLNLIDSEGNKYFFKEISIKDQSIHRLAPITRSFVGITRDDEVVLFGNSHQIHSMFKPGNYRCTDYVQPVNISETFLRESNSDEFEIVSYQVQVGYALTKNGSLYSWGKNELMSFNSQGEDVEVPVIFNHEDLPDPGQINSLFPLLPDEKIQTIKSGNVSSAFLTDQGRVIIAGINLCDDRNSTNYGRSELIILNGLVSMNLNERFVYISYGDDFGFAVTSQNRVFSWGCNSFGQIGNNTRVFSYKNLLIEEITNFLNLETDEKIEKISAGNGHVIALTSNGRVFVWGSNSHGQLGTGNNEISIIPVEITDNIIS